MKEEGEGGKKRKDNCKEIRSCKDGLLSEMEVS